MSSTEREVKVLNVTDSASNYIVNALGDPGFEGTVHEAEKKVSRSMTLNLVSA